MTQTLKTFHDRGGEPALSAVMVSPGGFDGILPTLYDLADQTVADRIELLVATPTPHDFAVSGNDFKRLHSFHVVDAGRFRTRGEGAAPAVLNARGDVVALVENHVFPDPQWAETILTAYDGPWTGVTARLEIYNPERYWARVSSFMDYGLWIGRTASGEVRTMPWHNSTYKRDALLPLGDELFELLEPESRLQERLIDAGHRFYAEHAARLRHLATSTARLSILSALGYGRLFALNRRADWSPARRLLYALCWPVFPLIRLAKLKDELSIYRRAWPVAPLLPGILILLFAASFGECLGYLGGMGASDDFLKKHDLYFEYRAHPLECDAILRRVRERRNSSGGPPSGKSAPS